MEYLCLLIGLGLLFGTLGFAIYGLVVFAGQMGGAKGAEKQSASSGVSGMDAHIHSTCTILNWLYRNKRLTAEEYGRLRDLVEAEHGYIENLPRRLVPVQSETPRADEKPQTSSVPFAMVPASERLERIRPAEPKTQQAPEPEEILGEEITLAEVVEVEEVQAKADPPPQKPPSQQVALSAATPPEPATWQLPEAQQREPRRPLSEMLAGFMQERNIRWGELASGILIVGSAVGLVVSLREQLRDTIPYFPALLFMLLTGAIHAAGIYTLKRWKLRDTSRGVLIIGLLLVPLNFLSACILTGQGDAQRSLTDPVYWLAMVVGLVAFAAMTWTASKVLLRRGYLPLALSIFTCSFLVLVYNRVSMPWDSRWQMLLFTLPPVGGFLMGVLGSIPQQWSQRRLSERSTTRLFLLLGLSAFALASVAALLVVRAPHKMFCLLDLVPAFCVVALVTSAIGICVRQRRAATESVNYPLVGDTLAILGFGLAACGLMLSIANSTTLLVTSSLCMVALVMIVANRRLPQLLPAAWFCLGIAALTALNLQLGVFRFGEAISFDSWAQGLVSPQAGICLLAVALAVVGCDYLLRRFVLDDSSQEPFRLNNYLSAGGALVLGGVLALAASFVHRDDPFSVGTASVLLLLVTLGSLVCAARGLHDGLPYVSGLLLVMAWWHALVWNAGVGEVILNWSGGLETRYAWICVLAALPLAAAALAYRVYQRAAVSSEILRGFCVTGGVLLVASVVSGGFLLVVPVGNASLTLLATLLAVTLLTCAVRMTETRVLFASISLALVMVVVADISLYRTWCESLWTSQQLWLQLIAVASWCLAATTATAYLRHWSWGAWMIEETVRVDVGVRYALAVMFALTIGVSMTLLASAEISSRIAAHPDTMLQLRTCLPYAIVGGVGVVLALMWESLHRPRVLLLVCCASTWFAVTTLLALPFEEARAVGSALRWLMPCSGVVLAVIWVTRQYWQPVVPALRRAVRLAEAPSLSHDSWQAVINVSLAIPVIVTLLISSSITIQYLLYGLEALGGPAAGSLLGDMKKDVSFGIPIAILVSTCLLYAVSEQRSWLAVVGSGVLQYVVGLSLVLLFLSPHPQLATERFLNILQAVSLGMTVYGTVWFWFDQRIGPTRVSRYAQLSQLDLHGVVNVVLVSSLGILILQRVFWFPEAAGGWVNAAGGWLGFAAFGALLAWTWMAWRQAILHGLGWFLGLAGVVASAFIASQLDRQLPVASWWPFRTILLGCVMTVAAQYACVAIRRRQDAREQSTYDRLLNALPMLCVGILGTLFAVRGNGADAAGLWFYLGSMLSLVAMAVLYGFTFTSSAAGWVAACGCLVSGTLFVERDPFRWQLSRGISFLHVWVICLAALSLVWLSFYLVRRRQYRTGLGRSFVWLPNAVALGSSVWCLLAVLVDWLLRSLGLGPAGLEMGTGLGWTMLVTTGGLLLLQVANDRSRLVVVCRYLWFASLAILVGMVGARWVRGKAFDLALNFGLWSAWLRPLWVAVMLSVMTAAWAQWYRCRDLVRLVGKRLRLPRRAAVQRAIAWQVPLLHLPTAVVVLALVVPAIFWVPERSMRYICGLSLFPLAFGFGGFAATRRTWVPWCSLATLTVAGILLAWADLQPSSPAPQWLARMLIVLCASVFVYGVVMPRLLNAESQWLTTIRLATAATCVLAAVSLAGLLGVEWMQWNSLGAALLPIPTALAVAVMLLAAMAGLIAIAVLPQHDPLSLNLEERMLYVYAAQVIGAAIVGHLYLSMPWLFRFGVEKYWPYVAMGLAFAGVAFANLLKKRELTVLATPFFHTAAIIPVAASVIFWPVASEADPSLVMLMAGGIYLLIGTTRSSLLSGAIAILFANIALWLFYDRFDILSFVKHPQIWLIPPALSVLLASQWQREKLTKQQLTACRYMCVVVIYISSTAEIYISGVGTALWPPVILALLSVTGILVGMLLQVRAYLYLGSTFLLLAMITMVSHAQQRLEHVWPWWAFGIALGIAILVFFGLFEKKKNEMRAMAQRFNEWDY